MERDKDRRNSENEGKPANRLSKTSSGRSSFKSELTTILEISDSLSDALSDALSDVNSKSDDDNSTNRNATKALIPLDLSKVGKNAELALSMGDMGNGTADIMRNSEMNFTDRSSASFGVDDVEEHGVSTNDCNTELQRDLESIGADELEDDDAWEWRSAASATNSANSEEQSITLLHCATDSQSQTSSQPGDITSRSRSSSIPSPTPMHDIKGTMSAERSPVHSPRHLSRRLSGNVSDKIIKYESPESFKLPIKSPKLTSETGRTAENDADFKISPVVSSSKSKKMFRLEESAGEKGVTLTAQEGSTSLAHEPTALTPKASTSPSSSSRIRPQGVKKAVSHMITLPSEGAYANALLETDEVKEPSPVHGAQKISQQPNPSSEPIMVTQHVPFFGGTYETHSQGSSRRSSGSNDGAVESKMNIDVGTGLGALDTEGVVRNNVGDKKGDIASQAIAILEGELSPMNDGSGMNVTAKLKEMAHEAGTDSLPTTSMHSRSPIFKLKSRRQSRTPSLSSSSADSDRPSTPTLGNVNPAKISPAKYDSTRLFMSSSVEETDNDDDIGVYLPVKGPLQPNLMPKVSTGQHCVTLDLSSASCSDAGSDVERMSDTRSVGSNRSKESKGSKSSRDRGGKLGSRVPSRGLSQATSRRKEKSSLNITADSNSSQSTVPTGVADGSAAAHSSKEADSSSAKGSDRRGLLRVDSMNSAGTGNSRSTGGSNRLSHATGGRKLANKKRRQNQEKKGSDRRSRPTRTGSKGTADGNDADSEGDGIRQGTSSTSFKSGTARQEKKGCMIS